MRIIQSCADCLYDKQQHLTDDEGYLAEVRNIIDNRDENDTSPYLVYLFNQAYERRFGKRSPYKELKRKYNDLVLSLEPKLREKIEASSDPLATSLIYSRLGNYIDFGAMNTVDEDTFLGLEMEAFEYVNKLNFIGTVQPCQVFLPALVKTHGSIVNVSSMAAWQPMTKGAAYAAAKAGISNFTLWLANHLAPMGVRVNAVAPGFFITDQNRFLLMEPDGVTPTPRGRRVIAHTPMGCFGDPSDLCGPVRFLVSADARFVTGVVLPVDGGFMASSGV